MLVVLYDDTGLAAWSPFGGWIEMPTLQRLADDGLIFSQWHTTALCSPTRSTFLTGRYHHQNGFAQISEGAQGYPGYSSHIPPENGSIAHVLREAGWSTFWVGKNHNVPVDEWGMGASKKNWPLGMGYDRFYGFMQLKIYPLAQADDSPAMEYLNGSGRRSTPSTLTRSRSTSSWRRWSRRNRASCSLRWSARICSRSGSRRASPSHPTRTGARC